MDIKCICKVFGKAGQKSEALLTNPHPFYALSAWCSKQCCTETQKQLIMQSCHVNASLNVHSTDLHMCMQISFFSMQTLIGANASRAGSIYIVLTFMYSGSHMQVQNLLNALLCMGPNCAS